MFNDDFESGNLNKWTGSATDGGDLSAHGDAALHGSYGLKCVINDANNLTVNKTLASAVTRFRVRFYLDSNSISNADWNEMTLLLLWAEDWGSVFRLTLEVTGAGIPKIKLADVTKDSGTLAGTAYTLTDEPHCIEIDWKASSGAGNDDGFISLWVDGTLKQTLSAIDNDTVDLMYIYFGTQWIYGGTTGTVYLDDFECNESGTEIGCISDDNVLFFGTNF